MTRLRSNQKGFTLIEVLVASSLMLVVLSATLTSFNNFLNNNRRTNQLNDLEDSVRNVADRMAQQLRNLANPQSGTQSTINYAGNNRLVFQTTDPNKQWVSYCYNSGSKIIWYQTSSKTTVSSQVGAPCPSRTPNNACGGASDDFTCGVQVGPNITNGTSRSVFTYAGENGLIDASSGLTASTDTQKIERVTVNIYVDNDTTKAPGEVNVQTGAFMRNQNQTPTAAFNVYKSGTQFTFDGAPASDPEDRTLSFYWYRESGTPSQMPGTHGNTIRQDLPDCNSTFTQTLGTTTWTCMGTGALLQSDFQTVTPTSQNIWLLVIDPGGLVDLSDGADVNNNCSSFTLSPPPTTNCRAITW